MDYIADLFRDAISVVIRIGGPILLLCMLVGVVTALLQAVTQIHEQTVSFLFKLIVVILCLVLGGDWMMRNLQEFSLEVFDMMLE